MRGFGRRKWDGREGLLFCMRGCGGKSKDRMADMLWLDDWLAICFCMVLWLESSEHRYWN